MDRKLRMGMVGGGPGAFIGEIHRKAARMDGGIDIVAGAFDIDPKKSRQMGRELCLDKKRVYNDCQTMIEKESALPADERIDFVSVCNQFRNGCCSTQACGVMQRITRLSAGLQKHLGLLAAKIVSSVFHRAQ